MLGRLCLVAGVFCGAFMPTMVHQLEALGWGPNATSGVRALVGTLVLGLLLRGQVLRVHHVWVPVLIMSLCMALGGACYVYANQHAPAGLVICIVYLGPLWVLGWDTLRGVRTPRALPAVLLGITGTACLAVGMRWDQPSELLGVVGALATSAGFAAYMVCGRRTADHGISPAVGGFWGMVLALVLFGWWLPSAPWSMDAAGWGVVLGLVNGVAYILLIGLGLRLVPSATESSILQYSEIVCVLAAIAGDTFTGFDLLGATCVAGAGLLIAHR